MKKLLLTILIAPIVSFGQYEIKLSKSNYADVDVKFTSSSYADLDIRFVDSESYADFTVGFTNSKSNATVAITDSNYADLDIKITDSNYADLDIRITESSYADVDIMIKKSGIVDYLIYSEGYLDKSEIIVACLPILVNFKEDIEIDEIPLFIEECGGIIKPEYKTNISDEFEGWDFDDKIYELDNGLKVTSFTYSYSYSYRPSISLYYCDRWYASVDGGELVPVTLYR